MPPTQNPSENGSPGCPRVYRTSSAAPIVAKVRRACCRVSRRNGERISADTPRGLAPKAVEKEYERKQAQEGFGLAPTGREVQQRHGVGVLGNIGRVEASELGD